MQTLNLPIQIIINRQVSANPWLDYSYQINGVVPKIAGQDNADFIAVEENDFMQKHFRSSTLQLFEDACVSYYQNLMADSPQLYVITKPSDDEFGISPLLVTVDYNEAHAYSGSETQVHTCAIHPQLYRQIEDFVVRFITTKNRINANVKVNGKKKINPLIRQLQQQPNRRLSLISMQHCQRWIV